MFPRPTFLDDSILPMLTLDGPTSITNRHSANFDDAMHTQEMAAFQRRLRLGTMLEMMYGPDELPLATMPSQHLGSQWNPNSSTMMDLPAHASQPRNQIISQSVDMFPSFDVQHHQTMGASSECDSHNSTPEYFFPSDSFQSMDTSLTQKRPNDWGVPCSMTFEATISDGNYQNMSPHAPDIRLQASDPPSWDEMNLWVMDNMDLSPSSTSNSSRCFTPFESSCYLSPSSAFTSPYSSAPHSPSLTSSRSNSPNSPLNAASSLPQHTIPHLMTSLSLSKAKGKGKEKICSHCKATSTPLWRRDPSTQLQLCNACGLYLQQRHKMRPQELIDADADEEDDDLPYDPTARECSHCHTRNTSVWRRNMDGEQLCNACGVYQRLRGKDRPLSLRRNRIKPRTKKTVS